MLQLALPLALGFGLLFVAADYWWFGHGGWGSEHKSYEVFEQDVREQKVKRAVVDGNILRLEYEGGAAAVVLTPSVDRSVELMLKKGVQVEALRAVPGSGLTLPVLALALAPYPILAYLALGLLQAVGSGAEFSGTEHLLASPDTEPVAEKPALPTALEDSIETADS